MRRLHEARELVHSSVCRARKPGMLLWEPGIGRDACHTCGSCLGPHLFYLSLKILKPTQGGWVRQCCRGWGEGWPALPGESGTNGRRGSSCLFPKACSPARCGAHSGDPGPAALGHQGSRPAPKALVPGQTGSPKGRGVCRVQSQAREDSINGKLRARPGFEEPVAAPKCWGQACLFLSSPLEGP